MKKIFFMIAVTAFIFGGCSENSTNSPEIAGGNAIENARASFITYSTLGKLSTLESNTSCVDLFAGQTIDAGDVCVEVVNGDLCVTYTTSGDWELDEYHLWVGTNTDDMPQTKKGSPKLGKFPYTATNLGGGASPVTSVTVCVSADELGLGELCDTDNLKVVAHAVVEKDTDGDGEPDAEETAYADGDDLDGSSWATVMNVSLCTVEVFDAEGLEGDLDAAAAGGVNDGAVGLKVFHQGGNSGQPYFRGQLDYEQDGNTEQSNLPFYCVDLANAISSNRDYCALMLSSYSNTLPSEIKNPGNLDLANYVLNTYSIGDDINGTAITGGDIQRVMWKLVYGDLVNAGAYSSGPSSDANVNYILADAEANGESFTPPCDGVVGVILYPVDCTDEGIAGQVLIGQVLVTEFPATCKTVCTICL